MPEDGYSYMKNPDGSATLRARLNSAYRLNGICSWRYVDGDGSVSPVILNLYGDMLDELGPAAAIDCEITLKPVRPGNIQL